MNNITHNQKRLLMHVRSYVLTGILTFLFILILHILIPSNKAYSTPWSHFTTTAAVSSLYPVQGMHVYEYVEQLN